ncbi:40S small subunit processome assembly factor 1-like [Tachypleus tridentatus]|uniref:40S small subunit processome assembly factor 1-like n=1 Tax=Tachypleus tridentatus TaxID=6853 RepID=UPI003FD4719C
MIQRIKDELDLEKIRDYTSLSTVSSSEQTVLTNNSNSRANPEVVVFPKHPKKKSLHSDRKPDEDNDLSKDRPELDLQKARYEVLKFGISGFEKQRKEEAEIALAIKLGAKPPKNQYVNYKQLIEERKQKKTETNEQSTVNRKLGLRPGNVSQKQRKRNKNAVPRFDPQVGVYRGGIQFIHRKDLDHIKKTSHQKRTSVSCRTHFNLYS